MNQEFVSTDCLSDEALAQLVVQRNVDAFNTLYHRYLPVIYGMGVAMLGQTEAEEVVQDVFLRYWRRAGQYDSSRGPFRPWFTTLARNHILNLLRTRGLERRIAVANDVERILAAQIDTGVDLERSAADRERQSEIRAALGALPAEQRRVLLLAYFGGLTQSQIADELNLPLGTVKKRTQLGLRKLRAMFGIRSADSTTLNEEPGEGKVVRR